MTLLPFPFANSSLQRFAALKLLLRTWNWVLQANCFVSTLLIIFPSLPTKHGGDPLFPSMVLSLPLCTSASASLSEPGTLSSPCPPGPWQSCHSIFSDCSLSAWPVSWSLVKSFWLKHCVSTLSFCPSACGDSGTHLTRASIATHRARLKGYKEFFFFLTWGLWGQASCLSHFQSQEETGIEDVSTVHITSFSFKRVPH